MASILALYPTVLVPLFSFWIQDIDLACLDIAVCNSSLRQQFLGIVRKCKISNVDDSSYGVHLAKCEWMAFRGIGVKRFNIRKKLTGWERTVLRNSKSLELLKGWGGSALFEALDLCPNVQMLELHGGLGPIDVLIPKFVTVQGLDLKSITELQSIVSKFFESFSGLSILKAPAIDVSDIVRNNIGLTEVDVYANIDVVAAIADSKSITSVTLSGKMIDNSLLCIAKSCPNLREFTMASNFVSDSAVVVMAESCPGLTCFQMGQNNAITDAALQALMSHCRLLEKLSISSTKITDTGVNTFVTYSPNLTHLSLNGCSSVSDVSLRDVLLRCRQLTYLDVSDTKFTDKFVSETLSMYPQLHTLKAFRKEGRMNFGSSSAQIVGVNVDKTIRNVETIKILEESMHWKESRRQFAEKSLYGTGQVGEFSNIWYYNSNLLEVYLHLQHHIEDTDFEVLVACCRKLTSISLLNCRCLTGSAVMWLEESCLPLKKLHLMNIKGLSDQYVLDFVRAKTYTLKTLLLEGQSEITAASLEGIVSTDIESLTMKWCNLTTAGVCHLIKSSSALNYLEIESKMNVAEILQAMEVAGREPMHVEVTEQLFCVKWIH